MPLTKSAARQPNSLAPATVTPRVPEIDALRFFAASAVVVYTFTYRPPPLHGIENPDAFAPLQAVTRFGYLGVHLFLMISGFVILRSSQERSAGEFAIARFARLFPSFWVCALLTTLVVNLWGIEPPISLRTLALNFTMVPSLFGADYVDGGYWTLLIVLKFYLLVYLVLLSGTMRFVEAWLGLWLACSVAAALQLVPHWLASIAIYPFGPYLISGCLCFLVRSRGMTAFRAVGLVIACALAARHVVEQQPGFMRQVTPVSSVVVASAVVAFHAMFVTIALVPDILRGSKWWYILGSLAYPLYLLHNAIGKNLWGRLPDAVPPAAGYVILFATVYAMAAVVAAATERRACPQFRRLLQRFAARFKGLRSSPA